MSDNPVEYLINVLGGGITLQEDGAYLSEDAGELIEELVIAALVELDDLVDENCKSTSFALAYGKAWETVATKYGWVDGDPEPPA